MNELEIIKSLVGDVTEEQMRYIDRFVSRYVSLFIPAVGYCDYAVTPSHTHPGYSFVITFDNNCKVRTEGKLITADSGMLVAFSPDVPHEEIPSGQFSRYIAVFINKDYYDAQLPYYNVKPTVFRGESVPSNDELLRISKEFMVEYGNDLPAKDILLEAAGLKITHEIIRAFHNIAVDRAKISDRIEIDRAIEYMHQNFPIKITVDDLAKFVAMSPSHFTRLFKKETTLSPMEYLNTVRLEKAKKLLISDDRSITEIAYDCGFNSSSYLSDKFSKKFNVSPTEFKKKFKKQ